MSRTPLEIAQDDIEVLKDRVDDNYARSKEHEQRTSADELRMRKQIAALEEIVAQKDDSDAEKNRYNVGYTDGYSAGKKEGYEAGYLAGSQNQGTYENGFNDGLQEGKEAVLRRLLSWIKGG